MAVARAKRAASIADWRFSRMPKNNSYYAVSVSTRTNIRLGDDLELAWKRYKALRRGKQPGNMDYVG